MSQVQIWICIRGKNVGSATRPATLSDPLPTDRQPCRIRYQQTSNPASETITVFPQMTHCDKVHSNLYMKTLLLAAFLCIKPNFNYETILREQGQSIFTDQVSSVAFELIPRKTTLLFYTLYLKVSIILFKNWSSHCSIQIYVYIYKQSNKLI